MAVNPVKFLVAANASVTNGNNTITVTGGVDCSRVYSGTAVFLGGTDNPAEAISGTAPDGGGNSTITLRDTWTQATVTNQALVAFNTNEGLAEAISNVREIVSNVSAIEDLTTQGLIKRIDDNNYEIVSISAQGESLVGASDAASQRTVLGLGSGATRDIQNDSIDNTAGRLMTVPAFGLGTLGSQPNWPNADLNDCSGVGAGIYRSINISANKPITANGVIYFSSFNPVLGQLAQLYLTVETNPIMYYRTSDGGNQTTPTWSPWVEIWHDGNLVKTTSPTDNTAGSVTLVGDFGLGEQNTPPTLPTGTTATPTGFYRDFSAAYPTSVSLFRINFNINRAVEFGGAVSGTGSRFYGRSQTTDNTWNPVVEFWHTGNLVKTTNSTDNTDGSVVTVDGSEGWFGLGGDGVGISDWNNGLQSSGFINAPSGTTNSPAGSLNLSGIRVNGINSNNGFEIAGAGSGSQNRVWFRSEGGSTYTDWTEFWHTGNLNSNEFGGLSAGDFIGYGYTYPTDAATILLPINSTTAPTSITVNGSFSIVQRGTAEVTASSVSLSANSSNKLCVLTVGGLSGFTANSPAILKGIDATSKITVNF